jgi:hypothetical protein
VTAFDLHVGVDWSGERGPAIRRLQVAACGPGTDAPGLVGNPNGGPWSRAAFARWLLAQAQGRRVVCGLDFSFCFPWEDRGAYFPGRAGDPPGHAGFWDLVEEICGGDGGFYGGALPAAAGFAGHFRQRGRLGSRYVRRLRVTEALTQARELGTAESVFNLVGARQVGKGSLAGMRLLRWLKAQSGGVAAWPFDPTEGAGLVLVETFPTAFVRMAGGGGGKIRDADRLNRVLAFFGSSAHAADGDLSDDMADALVTAAALRYLTPRAGMWRPPDLSDRVRRTEGWTFGIV